MESDLSCLECSPALCSNDSSLTGDAYCATHSCPRGQYASDTVIAHANAWAQSGNIRAVASCHGE
jgi:hypothetical protein